MKTLPRNRLIAALTAGLLVFAAGSPGLWAKTKSAEKAADPFAKIEITVIPLAGNVSMLKGSGGNIGLCVGPDGAFLVDDQYAPLTPKIRKAVASVTSEPLRFVLNTHYHPDHAGGNENLGEAGVLIVAHENVRERLSTPQFNKFFNRHRDPLPAKALPVVTYADAVKFHLNGETIRAFHIPSAHTDGDSFVHFTTSNVIHTGDVVFMSGYPFIDLSAGGSLKGMMAACGQLIEMSDEATKIIPGHGDPTDRAGLRSYLKMLDTVRSRVQTLIDSGKEIEAVVQAAPTKDLDARWGLSFMSGEKFTRLVYLSLTGQE